MVENDHVKTGQGEASSPPIYVEFKHFYRSARRSTKRTYENMQVPNTRTCRLVKRPRLVVDECFTDTLCTNGPSKEPATTSGTPSETTGERPTKNPTNASVTGVPAPAKPTSNKQSVDCLNIAEAPESSGTADVSTSTIHGRT